MTREETKLIDRLQEARAENNQNWMDLFRLSFKHAPEEAKRIMGEIRERDFEISDLIKELSEK